MNVQVESVMPQNLSLLMEETGEPTSTIYQAVEDLQEISIGEVIADNVAVDLNIADIAVIADTADIAEIVEIAEIADIAEIAEIAEIAVPNMAMNEAEEFPVKEEEAAAAETMKQSNNMTYQEPTKEVETFHEISITELFVDNNAADKDVYKIRRTPDECYLIEEELIIYPELKRAKIISKPKNYRLFIIDLDEFVYSQTAADFMVGLMNTVDKTMADMQKTETKCQMIRRYGTMCKVMKLILLIGLAIVVFFIICVIFILLVGVNPSLSGIGSNTH